MTHDARKEQDREDGPVDQALERYLAYLEGLQPTAPSFDELTDSEREELNDLIELLMTHWGSRIPDVSTPDVVVAYHSEDRGWGNWIVFELERAGYTCWADAFDLSPTLGAMRREHHGWTVFVTSMHSVQASPSFSATAGMAERVLAVRVDDCEADWLEESSFVDSVDLVGSAESDARAVLLRALDRQDHESELSPRQRYGSAVDLFLERKGMAGGSLALLLAAARYVSSASDADWRWQPWEPPELLYWPQCLAESRLLVPPLVRDAMQRLLSPYARRACAEVAIELVSLVEVNVQLGSVEQARTHYRQAMTFTEIACAHDASEVEPGCGERIQHWRRAHQALAQGVGPTEP